MYNLFRFYNNRVEIKAKFPFLKLGLAIKIWTTIETAFVLMCFVGTTSLFFQQLYYTYNDATYYDLTKVPDMERHMGYKKLVDNFAVSLIYKSTIHIHQFFSYLCNIFISYVG